MAGPSIDKSFVKQFEDDVHTAFQRMGSKCRATVRTKSNITGSSDTFQRVGKGSASTKSRHGVIPPMNIDHEPVECTLTDYFAGDFIDKFDTLKIQHDERKVVTDAGAYALGRKSDELIFDAASQTATSEGGSGRITLKRVLSAIEELRGKEVPMETGEVYGWLTTRAEAELLNSVEQFTNADYVGVGQFANAYRAREWLNVKWMVHNGLPGAFTDGAECLIWHKTALGHCSGADVETDVTWDGQRYAHWVNNAMSQGACLIDAEGVVKIPVDDTAALS